MGMNVSAPLSARCALASVGRMTALRVYTPAECDVRGVPLDWERCRTCEGTSVVVRNRGGIGKPEKWQCPTCDGHGSLKAAALAALSLDGPLARNANHPLVNHGDARRVRCEDCGHPMSEGTWEGPRGEAPPEYIWRLFTDEVRSGRWPEAEWIERRIAVVHYSRCDEGCRHGGPGRYKEPPRSGEVRIWKSWQANDLAGPGRITDEALGNTVEASWRPVDVRCLSWPHDLRPEQLAVLCLRCYAPRSARA